MTPGRLYSIAMGYGANPAYEIGARFQGATYQCSLCDEPVDERSVEEHCLTMGICERRDCVETRVRNLMNQEAAIGRIAQILKPRQMPVDLEQLTKELRAVALTAEFNQGR